MVVVAHPGPRYRVASIDVLGPAGKPIIVPIDPDAPPLPLKPGDPARTERVRSSRESESELLTLGQTLAAGVRLIVWCKTCDHRTEPDIATRVAHHGSGMPVPDWARLLRCTKCGERDVDFVASGARR